MPSIQQYTTYEINKLLQIIEKTEFTQPLIGLNDINLLLAIKKKQPIFTDINYTEAWNRFGVIILKIGSVPESKILTRTKYVERLTNLYAVQACDSEKVADTVKPTSIAEDRKISFDIFGTLLIEKQKYTQLYKYILQLESKHAQEVLAKTPLISFIHQRNIKTFYELQLFNNGYAYQKTSEILNELEPAEWYTPNIRLIDAYNKIPANKKALVSDTHLETKAVVRLLKYFQIQIPQNLYLSSTYGATKAAGDIWKHAAGYDIHVGDDIISDLLMPPKTMRKLLIAKSA